MGVVLATGVYASMHLANEAVKESFWTATERLAGSAQLAIRGGDAGVPEAALDRARTAGCVDAAAGLVVRVVSSGFGDESGLVVLGIDLLDEPRFREYRLEGDSSNGMDDALAFLAQPDSVLVTRQLAGRHGLKLNSELPVWTGNARRLLRVRGFLADAGVARAYGGAVAVMDVYAAQHIFSRRGFFDRIDLTVRPGEDVDRCRVEVAQAVGAHLKVEPPPSREGRVASFSATYLLLVESSALLGALIAMFLVHHAAAISVAQREKEIAILLGLGADERAIARTILLEGAAVGLCGAAGGIVAGALGARYLGAALGKLMESSFGVALAVGEPTIDWMWAAATIAVASLFCAFSALAPARHAASVAPIQLAEARRYSAVPEKRGRGAILLAVFCAAMAALWQCFDRRPGVLYVTLPLAVLSLGLMARALTSTVFRVLRPAFAALWPLEGRFALDGLIRTNRKTRGALIGLSLTTATVFAISSLTAGYAEAFHTWTRQIVNGDFLIHSSANLGAGGELFPAALGEKLKAVPGVAAVLPLRRFYGEVEGRRARLMATDLRLLKRYGAQMADGAEYGAVLSRIFANRSGRRTGERIQIASPNGFFELNVVGVIDDYSSESGSLYIDWQVYRERFHDDAVETFAIYLTPGASKEDTRRALLARFERSTPAVILDGDEFRAQLDAIVARWRGIGFVQIGVAWILSFAGVASFLIVSIRERRHELALLSVLGATPEQVRRSVVIEALGVAAAGLILGFLLGIVLDVYLWLTLRYSVNGFELPWTADMRVSVGLLVSVPLGALLAAALPIRWLNRMQLASEVSSDA
jgi:putative ABC transport system permease protein